MSQKDIRESIVTFLQSKGNYQDSDSVLIDELLFNIYLIKEAKKDIRERGMILNAARKENAAGIQTGDDKKNKSLEIYIQANKEVKQLYTQLGISPQERIKLKIELAKEEDLFEKVFG